MRCGGLGEVSWRTCWVVLKDSKARNAFRTWRFGPRLAEPIGAVGGNGGRVFVDSLAESRRTDGFCLLAAAAVMISFILQVPIVVVVVHGPQWAILNECTALCNGHYSCTHHPRVFEPSLVLKLRSLRDDQSNFLCHKSCLCCSV